MAIQEEKEALFEEIRSIGNYLRTRNSITSDDLRRQIQVLNKEWKKLYKLEAAEKAAKR
jgi:hypothetical protein